MYKVLNETKTREKNKTRVNTVENRLTNLMEVLKSKMMQKKLRNMNRVLEIIERILYFNQLNQPGQGLKILPPSQMISRLPIPLAQLKSENNPEKLKNEIRHLLYSLYRSKKFTENIY